ncbi:hypothetical protein V8E54_014260 [Elaphomyces granulatus]
MPSREAGDTVNVGNALSISPPLNDSGRERGHDEESFQSASSTSANAATNVTTDVSPEPVILQIQDNGGGGGDDFVEIDDMLLDELDLEELDLSWLLRRLNLL